MCAALQKSPLHSRSSSCTGEEVSGAAMQDGKHADGQKWVSEESAEDTQRRRS